MNKQDKKIPLIPIIDEDYSIFLCTNYYYEQDLDQNPLMAYGCRWVSSTTLERDD